MRYRCRAMTEQNETDKPAIVLVNPQMGENIGTSARAMFNCALTDLRLVNPRDGWPSAQADATASGAFELMPPVQVFEKTADALSDCHYVYATTARPRDMVKPVFTAKGAAEDMHKRIADGQKIAVLFGAERSGLDNEDVSLAHAVITVPLNPAFTSLNLAQGVLLVAYEWLQAKNKTPARQQTDRGSLPASHDELNDMFERLETELDKHHFFRDEHHKPIMSRNLRNMLSRAEMTEQEVRTFQGVISALTGKKVPPPEE